MPRSPAATIGVNGLAGNLGIAVAALVTGLLVKHARLARRVRGAGPRVASAAASCSRCWCRRKPRRRRSARSKRRRRCRQPLLARVLPRHDRRPPSPAACCSTSRPTATPQLLQERFARPRAGPGDAGRAAGGRLRRRLARAARRRRLIDRYPAEAALPDVVVAQAPLLRARRARARAGGCFAVLLGFMVAGVRRDPVHRCDDRALRRRPACARASAGMRLAVSFGVSSLAVWLLGPVVKAAGFDSLLLLMAGIALARRCWSCGCPTTIRGQCGQLAEGGPAWTFVPDPERGGGGLPRHSGRRSRFISLPLAFLGSGWSRITQVSGTL